MHMCRAMGTDEIKVCQVAPLANHYYVLTAICVARVVLYLAFFE